MDAGHPALGVQRRGRAALSGYRLGAGHVGELAAEIAPLVTGLALREVVALPPRDLLLVLARASEGPPDWRLLVSASGDAPRMHVQRGPIERHAGPVGPFFRAAVEELTGSTVRGLSQVAGDRIVALAVRRADGEARTLIAEVVGRHANLCLLGPGDRVLAVLVPPPADKDDPRLAPGKPYAPPPGRATGAAEAPLAEVLPRAAEPAPLRRQETRDLAPLSWRVECALGAQARAARRADLERDVAERLERRLKNARALVHGLEQRLLAAEGAERLAQDGELLKANLHAVQRGAAELEVADFFDPEQGARRIALDQKLSPQENLARIFERAKKLERSRASTAREIELARQRVAALNDALALCRARDSDLEAIERDAIAAGLLEERQPGAGQRAEKPAPRLPYKIFRGAAGSQIRVGRNARDNDELTFRHARGNDLWLHTADAPGSHVVLPVEKNAEPHPEELIDAAHLAAWFSPLQGATRARVHVAHRKEVHKPRGAKPGLVTLSGGRILELRVQPERLQRLLGTHAPPGR